MSDVQQLIMELLDSASSEPPPDSCSACGAAMKYFNSAVFYQEKKWTVRLASCPVCRPELPSTHNSAGRMDTPICFVCKQPVRLEYAKTDENGKAVHEDCYLQHLMALLQSGGRSTPNNSPMQS